MLIHRSPKPWFSENSHYMKRQTNRSEKLCRKYHQPKDYENFKTTLNKYLYALKHEKESTLSQNVLISKGDSKKLYRFMKELTGSKSDTLCQL